MNPRILIVAVCLLGVLHAPHVVAQTCSGPHCVSSGASFDATWRVGPAVAAPVVKAVKVARSVAAAPVRVVRSAFDGDGLLRSDCGGSSLAVRSSNVSWDSSGSSYTRVRHRSRLAAQVGRGGRAVASLWVSARSAAVRPVSAVVKGIRSRRSARICARKN